jgi:drug/metabolite transporter (DMT)-like permease
MKYRQPRAAVLFLTVACLFWGLSFPVSKALGDLYLASMPGESSWFVTGVQGAIRFLCAGLLMFGGAAPKFLSLTRREFHQGLRLGIYSGIGMILQVDGLNYTSASTSAFLTQAFCVMLPVYHTLRNLQFPTFRTIVSTWFVFLGVTLLARVDFSTFHIGRGELETLISTLFFTAQILELEDPAHASNRTTNVSIVMFLTIGLLFFALAAATNRAPIHFVTAIQSGPALSLCALLILFCTLGAFNLMNRWQRFITSTEAGLIYTAEPLFASLFALTVPSWISTWSGRSYENEHFSSGLIVGGGLIVGANLIMQLRRKRSDNIQSALQPS